MNSDFSIIQKLEKREEKPRQSGITLVEDIFQYSDFELEKLLDYIGDYIDIVKFPAISSLLVDSKNIKNRIKLYKKNNILMCLSGSMMELAYHHEVVDNLLIDAKKLNYKMVELSFSGAFTDKGNIEKLIEQVKQYNMDFFIEVGHKNSKVDLAMPFKDRIKEINRATELSAFKVILEGRNGNFLYNQYGHMRKNNIQKLSRFVDFKDIIFELPPITPTLEIMSDYINIVGYDVNLGNVLPNYAMVVEMFRRKWKGR